MPTVIYLDNYKSLFRYTEDFQTLLDELSNLKPDDTKLLVYDGKIIGTLVSADIVIKTIQERIMKRLINDPKMLDEFTKPD